jgi:hypothetical protein
MKTKRIHVIRSSLEIALLAFPSLANIVADKEVAKNGVLSEVCTVVSRIEICR